MTILDYLVQSLAWVLIAVMLGGALGGIGSMVLRDKQDR